MNSIKTPVCAVFDVGKTNKKVLVFDQHYTLLHEDQTPFTEIADDDGFHCDDLPRLTHWVRETYQWLLAQPQWTLRAVNVSAYGASFVYLDAQGQPLTPLYNYLREFPRELHQQFFEQYGPVDAFCAQTASPDLGMLNSGLQLYWLKMTKPALFAQIAYSLHLPQYIAWLLTGQPVSEITSVGCHTALWDFGQNNYHDWTRREGIAPLCQPPLPSTTCFTLDNGVVAGIGMHDSSAALVPYRRAFDEPFALLSTGTWAVSMNPFNDEPLTVDELRQDCLCYLGYDGRPVKASRLFAGNEHERHVRHLAEYFHVDLNTFRQVRYNPTLMQRVQAQFQQPKPADTYLTDLRESPFVERNLNAFTTYEEAYHQFMLDLIAQQLASLQLAIGGSGIRNVYVDGGFSRNDVFMRGLAAALPHCRLQASEVAQASALGTALVLHDHWNPLPFDPGAIRLVGY